MLPECPYGYYRTQQSATVHRQERVNTGQCLAFRQVYEVTTSRINK